MNKKLLEQIMSDSDRMVSGIGPASKSEVDSTVSVSNSKSLNDKNSYVLNPLMPMELGDIIKFSGDILEKTTQMRDCFVKALDNPSISRTKDKSKKMALKKSILALDEINSLLLKDIPNYLEMFR